MTPLIEQGKIKCHQYWPNLKDTMKFNGITVVTQAEEQIDTYAVVNSSAAGFNTFLYAVVSMYSNHVFRSVRCKLHAAVTEQIS